MEKVARKWAVYIASLRYTEYTADILARDKITIEP